MIRLTAFEFVLTISATLFLQIVQKPPNSTTVPESQNHKLSFKDKAYQSILHSFWGLVTISFFGGLLNARNLSASDVVEDVSTVAAAAGIQQGYNAN